MPMVRKLTRSAREAASWNYRRVDAPPFIAHEPGWIPQYHICSTVCRRDEEVEWTWTHTPQGDYVSGFTKIPRAAPVAATDDDDDDDEDVRAYRPT